MLVGGIGIISLGSVRYMPLDALYLQDGICPYDTDKGGTCPLKMGAGLDFPVICQLLQIREIHKKVTCQWAWFPNIQERNVSTGHVALVRIELLLEPGGISLDFSLAFGFCKSVLAWIREKPDSG